MQTVSTVPKTNSVLSLNIIFHGLCVFVGKRGGFQVLLPDLGPEHAFRAGVWLAETNIKPGVELSLEGVIPGNGWLPGTAILERRKNLMVLPEKSDKFPRSSAKPYATMVLPRPKAIHSLCPVVLTPGDDIVGNSQDSLYVRDDKTIWQSTIQIFNYDVSDETLLALTNHRWIPAFVKGVTNLHIFAEPETPQPVSHSITEFGEGSALFQGLDLRRSRASIVPQFSFDDLPPGVRKEELEDLVPRTKRMGFLGRYKCSGIDPGLAWDDQDTFGGDPTACVWGGDGS
jgi:hypothetical protein